MIKKVVLLEMEREMKYKANGLAYFENKGISRKIPTYFNTSLVKFINILKIKNEVVWEITLTNEEDTIYTKPFKV